MAMIEVNDEQLSELVVADLKQSLCAIKDDLAQGRNGIFSMDPDENRRELKRYIKALTLIVDYYGGND
jgi:hypothetical protein